MNPITFMPPAMGEGQSSRCAKGHSAECWYVRPTGRGECRACARENERNKAKKRRESALLAREWESLKLPCPDGARLIPLSGQRGKGLHVVVDEADYDELKYYRWHITGNAPYFYAGRKRLEADGPGSHIMHMHRILMRPSSTQLVDHINHDTLDNRRSNLRVCSKGENQRNQGKRSDNKSGYKGVRQTRYGKFTAEIGVDGKHVYLGNFVDVLQAVRAYNAAARKYHGEFALLNSIGADE